VFTNIHLTSSVNVEGGPVQQQSARAASPLKTRVTSGSHQYDQMWASASLSAQFTGRCSVVRDEQALRHPLIPDTASWQWNGLVSDHVPVVAEFYTHTQPQPQPNTTSLQGDRDFDVESDFASSAFQTPRADTPISAALSQ